MTTRPDGLSLNLKAAFELLQQSSILDSIEKCKEVLVGDPKNAHAHHILALCYRATQQLDLAASSISRSLSTAPNNASILNSAGLIFLESNKLDAAEQMLKKSIRIDNTLAAAQANYGHVLAKAGKTRQAEESYRSALSLEPELSDALIQLVLLLRKDGRLSELGDHGRLLSLKTTVPGLAVALGLTSLDAGDLDMAWKAFERAISLGANSASVWSNLGLVQSKSGNLQAAQASYSKALDLDSGLVEANINMADLLKYKQPELSRAYLRKAIERESKNAVALDMLGFTYFMEHKWNDANEFYEKALLADPSYQTAAFHQAGALFMKGDFQEAWRIYCLRYGETGVLGSPVKDKIPLWDPNRADNLPLLVWTDQGIGDEVLQLSIVVEAYHAHVPLVIATSERLVPIVSRSFPNAVCICKDLVQPHLISAQSQAPAFFLASKYKNMSIPQKSQAFLIADAKKTKDFREKYSGSNKNKILIGLSWKSNNPTHGPHKSIDLAKFLPILETEGCTFVVLQYGDIKSDISKLPDHIQQKIIIDDDVDPLNDLDTFASQASALDLILTTSNTTAHLAGALGVKTIAMVPSIGPGWFWYWFEGTDISPWYPSMHLARQGPNNNWTPAIEDAGNYLYEFVQQHLRLTSN